MAGSNAPGAFLVFFYPSVRTGSSNTSFFIITPPSGRGLVIPIFFPWFFFFWWSLAPDLRFSLGQTNTHRAFRYTGKGFYLE